VVAAGQAVLFVSCLFYINIAIVLRLEITFNSRRMVGEGFNRLLSEQKGAARRSGHV
jgi:hypothetical protein